MLRYYFSRPFFEIIALYITPYPYSPIPKITTKPSPARAPFPNHFDLDAEEGVDDDGPVVVKLLAIVNDSLLKLFAPASSPVPFWTIEK
jgi:hypothetical protein